MFAVQVLPGQEVARWVRVLCIVIVGRLHGQLLRQFFPSVAGTMFEQFDSLRAHRRVLRSLKQERIFLYLNGYCGLCARRGLCRLLFRLRLAPGLRPLRTGSHAIWRDQLARC